MRLKPGQTGGLTVAVTLDACPGAFDARLAGALVEMGVPATIFVTGAWMRMNPRGLAFLLEYPAIFALENHGEHHIPPVLGRQRIFGIESAGDLADVRREVEAGAASIRAATGRDPRWYRAATGFYSPAALAEIRRLGVFIGGYSLNGDLGASLPAAAVAARIGEAGDGDVIVSHVNQPRRSSGRGVAAGLRRLKARGARFLRLDQLTDADVAYA
jgi:peptidoglycan/xylan/chitin deacetylase (PgdA/CDA1 family)